MAVTMKDVRAVLDPEEPNYKDAAKLGAPALPHLDALVSSGDPMLASKATYLASLIKDAKAAKIVEKAARSDVPAVRVAAAAAASNLADPEDVLTRLVADADPGIRKVAMKSAIGRPGGKLAEKLKALVPDAPAGEAPAPGEHIVTGLMPGETGQDIQSGMRTNMPGELPGGMPGEHQKMPGE
jgi:hypothetical protein